MLLSTRASLHACTLLAMLSLSLFHIGHKYGGLAVSILSCLDWTRLFTTCQLCTCYTCMCTTARFDKTKWYQRSISLIYTVMYTRAGKTVFPFSNVWGCCLVTRRLFIDTWWSTQKVTIVYAMWVQLEEQASCSSANTMTIIYHIDLGYKLHRRE